MTKQQTTPSQKFRIVLGGRRGAEYNNPDNHLAIATYHPLRGASHPADYADEQPNGPCLTCDAIAELANRNDLFSISFMGGLYEVIRYREPMK